MRFLPVMICSSLHCQVSYEKLACSRNEVRVISTSSFSHIKPASDRLLVARYCEPGADARRFGTMPAMQRLAEVETLINHTRERGWVIQRPDACVLWTQNTLSLSRLKAHTPSQC